MSSLYVTAFRGELWIVKHDKQAIKASVVALDRENRQFTKLKESLLNIDIVGGDIKVLAFSCVVEASTGLRQPCLVIEQHHFKNNSILHFYFFVNERTLTKVSSFSHNSRFTYTNFMLSDGPSLSWISKDKIHFLRRSFQSTSLIYTSHLFTNDITTNLTLLWSGNSKGQFYTVCCSKEDVIIADAENGCNSSQGIVPSLYSSILACLCIYDALNIDSLNVFSNNGSYYKQEVYVGTTKGQLIKFTGGKFVSHWQLPFDDPCKIEITQTDSSVTCAIVQSQQNTVCVINLSQNKVVNKWSNQELLLIDDFLENGMKQLCLVQNTSSLENFMQGYLLATLDGKTIGLDQECPTDKISLNASQSSSECILSTIQALRTQFQASKSNLSELRIEYNNKMQMIDNTCKILHKTVGNSSQGKVIEECKKSSNLVHLIGDKASSENWNEEMQDNGPVLKQPEISHKIMAVWQRVIGSNWIIGVDLKDLDKRNVSDISLSLVSCSKENQTSSCQTLFASNNPRLVAVNHGDEHLTPSSKRKKLEHSFDSCVALVTTLPSFSKGKNISGLVTLSWTDCHDNLSMRRIISCGYVHLDIDQLIRGDLGISQENGSDQRQRDLKALKAISLETTLSISNLPSPFNILGALCKELDLVPITCNGTNESEEILRSASKCTGINEGVGIVVDSGGLAQQTEIQLFTRNVEQVYAIIHKIRDALPDDVIIKTSEKIRANADSHLLRSIHNVLVLTKEDTMRALSKKHHIPTLDMTGANCSDVKIRNIRKAFEEKRKKFCIKQTMS